MGGGRLATEVGGGELCRVTRRLDLAVERVLIRRQTGVDEHVGLELLGGRVGDRLLQTAVEVLQHFHVLRNEYENVHGSAPTSVRGASMFTRRPKSPLGSLDAPRVEIP